MQTNTIHITVLDSPVRLNHNKSHSAAAATLNQGYVGINGNNHTKSVKRIPVRNTARDNQKANWFTWLTRTTVALVIVVSIYFIFWLLLPRHSSVALQYSRFYEMIATVFMIISTVYMLIKIYKWRNNYDKGSDQNSTSHHVAVTIIAFILALACVSFIGFATTLPAYIALFSNDEALNYTEIYEPVFDILFIVVFLIFLPILIVFSIGFAPVFFIGEPILNILGSTLLLCFLQKWVLETLLSNSHLCEKLVEEGRSCVNHEESHFQSSLNNLTKREYHLYSMLHHDNPLIYTCTMELFPAVYALLVCMVRRRDEISANREYDPSHATETYQIVAGYILLVIALVMKIVVFVLQSILLRFYDDPNTKDVALVINAAVSLISYASNVALFWTVMETWHRIGDHYPIKEKFKRIMKKVSTPWTWTVFDLPDLAILILSGFFTLVISLIKFIVHIVVYHNSSLNALAIVSIFLGDLSNLFMCISFYIQFRLIKKFLLFNHESIEQLTQFPFVLHFPPVAIVINLLVFGAIYASKSSYLPPYPTENISYDNLLALLESTYPGSFLYSTTAAVCWAHVVERLYKGGAYRVRKSTDGSVVAEHHH